MAIPKKKEGYYTYFDYRNWPEDERWELIGGAAYAMTPSPGRRHQQIVGALYRIIAEITDKGNCETYIAPFDVLFKSAEAGDDSSANDAFAAADSDATDSADTVVQPDISVFCNPEETVREEAAHGAPDMVVEVLSPSTSHKDMTAKLSLYERHGVREYWVVNGEAPWVMVYRLNTDGVYEKPDYYRLGEQVKSIVLGGAEVSTRNFLKK